ncbi:MAG: tandem-95 repeat protein, partial [Calditrichaeota bacterium]
PVAGNIPDQSVSEGQGFATIALDDYVSDVDNADSEMNWTYSGNTELSVRIDANRVATITPPDADWNGSETITFTATDPGGLSDSDPAGFTVSAVNDAPVVQGIPNQSINEGESFATIALDDYVSDPDNADSEMNWTYSGNTELSVSIDGNRIATITTPDANWNGQETITFTATDPGGLSGNDAAVFSVGAGNDPPTVNGIPDQTLEEGQTFATIALDDYVNDVDNADSEMSWTYSGNTELSVRIDANRVATITPPDADWNGSETITFIATDPGGLSDSDPAAFTVTAVNDAPVVGTIPDQTIEEGQNFATIALDNYVSDVDNADSEMSWTYSGNTELSVRIDANRVATITPPDADWNGSETITFIATDPNRLKDSTRAVFRVKAVNDPPRIVTQLPKVAFAEDDSLDWTVSLWYPYVYDKETGASELGYTVRTTASNPVTVEDRETIRRFSARADWFGTDTLWLVVDDGEAADSSRFIVDVAPRNDPPVFQNLPDTLRFESGDSLTLSLYDIVRDIDTPFDLLQWSVNAADSGLQAEVDEKRAILILKAPAYSGISSLDLSVTDDSLARAETERPVRVEGTVSALDKTQPSVRGFYLYPNFPNPFNPTTTIQYDLQESVRVRLTLYDTRGRVIRRLVDARQNRGRHRVRVYGSNLAAGVYIYRLTTGQGHVFTRKMLLLK